MLIDQPFELRNALFSSKPIIAQSKKHSIIRDVILCIIIAGIGLMGTYFLMQSNKSQSVIHVVNQTEMHSVISSTK